MWTPPSLVNILIACKTNNLSILTSLLHDCSLQGADPDSLAALPGGLALSLTLLYLTTMVYVEGHDMLQVAK